jgi:magnesium chelatase accessory protein
VGFNPSLIPPPAAYLRLLAPLITPVATSGWATALLAGLSGHTRLVDSLLDSTQSTIPLWQRRRYATLFRNAAHVKGTMGLMAGADLVSILESGPSLKVPATFVVGSNDTWVPAAPLRSLLATSFPEAQVVEWEGGHLLHEANPERAAKLLGEALDAAPNSSVEP